MTVVLANDLSSFTLGAGVALPRRSVAKATGYNEREFSQTSKICQSRSMVPS